LSRANALGAFAALGALGVALASGIKELPDTWHLFSHQRARFEHLTPKERAEEPGTSHFLPVDAFNFFRSKLRDGDRFYLAVSRGPFFPGVDRPTAGRIFARYYLLPSIEVGSPEQADVVFAVGVDPHSLGLPLGRVDKLAGGDYFAARVRR
jgi:hypothetical protein